MGYWSTTRHKDADRMQTLITRVTGYVPVIYGDGKRYVILVQDYSGEALAALWRRRRKA